MTQKKYEEFFKDLKEDKLEKVQQAYREDPSCLSALSGRENVTQEAAKHGALKIINWLVEIQKVEMKSSGQNFTALQWAAMLGHLEVIQVLLAYGPSAFTDPSYGKSIPEFAALYGQLRILKWLFEEKMDLNMLHKTLEATIDDVNKYFIVATERAEKFLYYEICRRYNKTEAEPISASSNVFNNLLPIQKNRLPLHDREKIQALYVFGSLILLLNQRVVSSSLCSIVLSYLKMIEQGIEEEIELYFNHEEIQNVFSYLSKYESLKQLECYVDKPPTSPLLKGNVPNDADFALIESAHALAKSRKGLTEEGFKHMSMTAGFQHCGKVLARIGTFPAPVAPPPELVPNPGSSNEASVG